MSKKQHSHLLLTVFFVLLLIFCLFCFSFFLHIGVNFPDSVKKILWFSLVFALECNVRPLSRV